MLSNDMSVAVGGGWDSLSPRDGQVSLGTQIAATHAGVRDQQLALVGTVLLFLDAINPVSARIGAANGSQGKRG
jgi:hypothetical protein